MAPSPADCSGPLKAARTLGTRLIGHTQPSLNTWVRANDYHPHGDIEAGESYVYEVYNVAEDSSPQWERMVFVLNFDENGGFYDHVVPPTVVDDNVNPNPGPHPDYKRLGFRVLGDQRWVRSHSKKIEKAGPYEHCSVLRMIEWQLGAQADVCARRQRSRTWPKRWHFRNPRRSSRPARLYAGDLQAACPNRADRAGLATLPSKVAARRSVRITMTEPRRRPLI